MTPLTLELREKGDRLGLKGPRAPEWLAAQGIAPPPAPNTWTRSADLHGRGDALLVARLGAGEFFLEDAAPGTTLRRISPALERHPAGVYPVLREDWAFLLGGERVHDVLAQVCNVNFAELPLESYPLIMTLMIGVSVLIVPESAPVERQYRLWCDPTFGPYLSESLGALVVECGGSYRGVSA